ncbi:MAG: hypothetical protein GW939_01920 [Candidatus Magasanikbacteria bacterium]|nr:hypothetical protein [Candidatus Magasanikbacteria bacterium]NCS71769.1 hypothetical protein [Candidatus Magasanikbacteria bacterium]
MENIKKLIEIAHELEKEIEHTRRSAAWKATCQVIVTFLQLQGVVFPGSGCFCFKESTSDDEVRAYYTSLFSALRNFGFSDSDLRIIVARHQSARIFTGYRGELDLLDPESWVSRRGGICCVEPEWWAELVATHLLYKGH